MQWKRSTTWSERPAREAKARWSARSLSPARSPSTASAHIPGSEKSGPITRTPARQPKHKRSSGLAPVSVWADTCTTWKVGGLTWTNRRQPKWMPKLPDWALPKRKATNGAGQKSANPNGHAPQNPAASQDAGTLSARVKTLSDQVGFSLSRSVLMAVAKVDTPDKVAANSVESVAKKLEDMLRGVERLRAAIGIAGQARYSELCKRLKFASDHLDDIPDREALRKVVEILEAEAVRKAGNVNPRSPANGASAQAANPPTAKELGETRYALIKEAQRVAGLRKMKVA